MAARWRPLREALTGWLGLGDMHLAWPAWFNCWFSFALAYGGVGHGYSPLFVIVINLNFMFSLECLNTLTKLWAFMRAEFFFFVCVSVLGVASGPGVGLAGCGGALAPLPHPPPPPPVVYSTDCFKAVVLMLVLLFVALWFILRGDLFYVLACVILFLCFSVLLILRLPRLGKRELILVLFVRLFDLRLFGFVCFLFLLVSGKGCGL